MSRLPHLLSLAALGALRLPNRVLMAPMTRARALEDGSVPLLVVEYFTQRASAGLLLTDAVMPAPEAVGYPGTPGLWTDAQSESWRAVVAAVHAAGGRIAVQLMHCGRLSLPAFQPRGDMPVSASAVRAASTTLYSPRQVPEPAPEPRALDITEIPGVVMQFAAAAQRAREIGFDGVEIHAADGSLLDQFLRDGVNRRHDRFGGSADNRARLLLQVTEAVARVYGADRTGVRLSPLGTLNDMHDGNPLETFGTAVRHLSSLRLAWTSLNGEPGSDLTRRLRDIAAVPFVLTGGFTAELADAAIREELACAVSFGRPWIANPDLVDRFATGAELAFPDASTFYGGGARGYTDYPVLERESATPVMQPQLL